jgi:DNA invertase Pin-like site-specific DNA recombinase
MNRYFYARVSSKDQNLERQLEAARSYTDRIDRVFSGKQSGKNFERTAYKEMKSLLAAGDEVIMKELDRLGRNKELIKDELRWFKENGITVRILDIPTTLLDFGNQDWVRDMVTNILVEVLAAMAEQEREKRSDAVKKESLRCRL